MRTCLFCLLFAIFGSIKGQEDEATLFSNGMAIRGVNNEMSINCFTKVLELNPKNAAAFYQRGNTYACQKKYKESIEDYTRAIEIDSNFSEAYSNRGVSFARLNNHVTAINGFTKAIKLKSNYFDAYYNRAVSEYVLKQYSEAVEDYKKALQLKPNDLESKQFLRKAQRKISKKN